MLQTPLFLGFSTAAMQLDLTSASHTPANVSALIEAFLNPVAESAMHAPNTG